MFPVTLALEVFLFRRSYIVDRLVKEEGGSDV